MKPTDKIGKENPFRVPDGYFESLTERTMSAVKEVQASESVPTEKNERRIRLMPFLALAAAIVGFAVIAAAMARLVTRNENNILQGSNSEMYAEYISEEIDTYIIENEWVLPDDVALTEEEVQSEAIIDFLLLENVELTDIYELL